VGHWCGTWVGSTHPGGLRDDRGTLIDDSMHGQQITIELPMMILRRLTLLAEAAQQSVESLGSQSVLSNLPPATDTAPVELQTEFLRMQMLDVEEVRAFTKCLCKENRAGTGGAGAPYAKCGIVASADPTE
jgi:hypothetical protein